MKKMVVTFSLLLVFIGMIPLQGWAAGPDGEELRSKNNIPIKYGEQYYLFDKNLPNKGGVTFEAWASYDYVLFANDNKSNGAPIVIEPLNKNKKSGDVVKSGDTVTIRSVHSNWPNWHYWDLTDAMASNSVWLSDRKTTEHVISFSGDDKSVGLGTMAIEVGTIPRPKWLDCEGGTGEKAWMTFRGLLRSDANTPSPIERNTPFYLYEVSMPPMK